MQFFLPALPNSDVFLSSFKPYISSFFTEVCESLDLETKNS